MPDWSFVHASLCAPQRLNVAHSFLLDLMSSTGFTNSCALTALVASVTVEAVIFSAVIESLTGAGGRTGIIFENQTRIFLNSN